MNFKRLLLPVVLAIGTLFLGIEKTAAQQVNTYTFAQSNGTYDSLVNPTIFAVTTATNNFSGYIDSVSVLPFAVNFGGIAFTKCYMASDGYIFFGTSGLGSNTTTPLSSTRTSMQGIIAAWGTDLNAAYNVIGNGVTYNGHMSWGIRGTAPNRKIVFQWKNFHPKFSFSSGSYYMFDFQVALEETTNKVSVTYGGLLGFNAGASNTSGSTQVGLRGFTNSDYNNRYNGSFTLFTNSVAGGSNAATQSFHTFSTTPGMPTSGLTYTWTPTSSALICFAPTAVTTSSITNAGATISWTAPTLSVAAGGYQYEVRSSGSAGSGATGLAASGTTPAGTTTVAITGLAANTSYTVYVRSNCGGTNNFSSWSAGPAFRTACNVFVAPFYEPFGNNVIPDCWTNGNSINSTDPNLFWIPGQSYSGGVSYNGRPFGSFVNIQAASPYSAIVQLTSPVINLSGLTTPYIQFDWYKDNFNSAYYRNNLLLVEGYNGTAWVPLFSDTSNSDMWRTVGISLPASFNGITNAKFRFGVDKSVSLGNYEDFVLVDSFSVTNIPGCYAPGNIRAANIGATTVTLNWGAAATAPASGYQYEVRTSGAPGSGAIGLVVAGNTTSTVITANVTGLTAATNYTAYVRSSCGTAAGTSVWKYSLPFKTFCPAATAPYAEGFNTGALPDCWMTDNSTGGRQKSLYWKFDGFFSGGTFNNGRPPTSVAYMDASFPTTGIVRLTSPAINLSGLVTPYLKFDWFKRNNYSSNHPIGNTLLVEGYNGTSWVTLFASAADSNAWRTVNMVLPASFTGAPNARFRFSVNKSVAMNQYDDVLVDSFSVTTAPICLQPTFIAFSYATNNGSISWGAPAPAPAGGYQYEVRTSGAVGSGATGLLASGSTAPGVTFASISGINVLTTYTIYVRSDCGTNAVLSSWRSNTFTTNCFYLSIPVSEGFNTGALPSCWTNTNTGGSSSANLFWRFGAGFDHGTLSNGRPAGTFAFVDADAPQTDTVTLTSPEISFSGIASPFISFDWFKNNADPSATRANNNLQLEGYNGNTWVTLFNDTSNFNRWRTVDIPLAPAFTGVGNAKFRFRVNKALSGSNFDDVLLDNFFAGTIPICSKPTNVAVSAVTPTQATVNWTQAGVGNPTTWQISYGPSGVIAAAGTKMIVTTGSAIIQGLVPGTGYDVYVRALCNAANNNISAWSSVVSFTATPAGLNNITLDGELTLFPNPASEFVTIKNTSTQDIKHITVLNVMGAVVRETEAANGKEQRININGLAAGSYLVRVQLNGTTVVRRLQITK